MSFWAYMLHCRGGYFYVGHTDDLERRVGEHKSGLIPGYTADHLPVELVWSQDFATRDEATTAEKQIKGWSKAKKLALIRGDWDRISTLAKGKNSPSTSSGKTEEEEDSDPKSVHAELVEALSFSLQPHPDTPPTAIKFVCVEIAMTDENDVLLRFHVGDGQALRLPELATPIRKHGLWQHTCFEMFLRRPGESRYWEFNCSPSGEWAAYQFEAYREGMREFAVDVAPHVQRVEVGTAFRLDADIDLGGIPRGMLEAGFSAVIEETDGTKSNWALAHPPGKPDFHHPACFAATLPAPSAP